MHTKTFPHVHIYLYHVTISINGIIFFHWVTFKSALGIYLQGFFLLLFFGLFSSFGNNLVCATVHVCLGFQMVRK